MLRRRVIPLLRLGAYLFSVAAVVLFADYRIARASVAERLLGFGARMAPYLDDGKTTEAPRRIVLDGISFFVASGHTNHPLPLVRSWYAERYAEKGQLDAVVRKSLEKLHMDAPAAIDQYEYGDDTRGGLIALDMGGKMSTRELRARLDKLAKSTDLGAIGNLRYVYLERTSDGGTRFLTIWPGNEVKLSALSGHGRDVPGEDPANIPRQAGMRRTLTAHEDGMPQRLAAYSGPGSPPLVASFYRQQLGATGWLEDPEFAAIAGKQGRSAMRFVRSGGTELTLDLESAAGGRVNLVAIANR